VVEKIKKEGFIQSLFNGLIREDLFIPFPTYGKEERRVMSAMFETVRSFAVDQIDPVQNDHDHHIPDAIKQGLTELGLWGLIIPEEFGGCAQPEVVYNKIGEILNGVCNSTGVMLGGHLSIGLKAILLFGTNEQKKKFLPQLATGEKLAAFALTEPEAGSDAGNVKTTAKLSDDGMHYILNGNKQWITNGGIAQVFTILAKTYEKEEESDSANLTAFIVTRDMDGFSSGKEEDKLGICASSTTSLYLDNVKVPVENILGEIGGGFKIFMEVLNTGRLGLSAGCVGVAKAVVPHAIKHALEREQFKKTISEFEMIKEKFARVLVNIFTSESMVYFTNAMKELEDVPVAVEAAICKVYTSEALWQIVNDCLQVAGGNGFMKDYPYERFLRDSRINMIFEGTNEIQRLFIALSGLRRPSVRLGKYQKELTLDKEQREKQIEKIVKEVTTDGDKYTIEGFSEKLKDQIESACSLAQMLRETSIRAVLHHGRDIRNKQYIQRRLADAAIDLFGMFANIARVENLVRNNHRTAENAILISNIFSEQAKRRIQYNLDDVEENQDETLSKLAEILYSSKKYPLDILDY
jgi:acyl-CoA dehydrogenase family protein 9